MTILVVTVGAMAQTPNNVSTNKIKQRVQDFHNAEIIENDKKLAGLLTDNFNETKIDGRGVETTASKEKILQELRAADLPKELRRVFSKVKLTNEITDFSAQESDGKAVFKYNLTKHSQLKISKDSSDELKKIERFEVVGTSILRNGKWLLDSIQITFAPAKNIEEARNEIDDAFRFDMALVMLMAEAQAKKSERKPN